MDHIDILGVNVSMITADALLALFGRICASGAKSVVLNVNANCLNLAYTEPWLKAYLNRAEAVFVDGYGVRFAAWLLGRPLPTRITYADWMWDLGRYCAEHDLSLYFVGAKPGVAAEAAERLTAACPGLRVHGTHHGYFDKHPQADENRSVIEDINRAKPDILIVGFGMPIQERWLMENWEQIGARIALTGGGVFDFVSGRLKRPPRILTDHGLEWLGRLFLEPRRLWRRYLLGNPLFVLRVLRQRLGPVHAVAPSPVHTDPPRRD
jgi:N-acetylglucosaminyldiphosphoundecaprenol N-acetyl-beta-D-mannosaminyltransferase